MTATTLLATYNTVDTTDTANTELVWDDRATYEYN